MAPVKKSYDDTVVAPSGQSLSDLAGWFQAWSTEVDVLTGDKLDLKLTPGQVSGAKELKERFDSVLAGYKGQLVNLQKTLYALGRHLTAVARVYTETDDLSKDDAERLRDLINEVDGYLPGVKNVLPEPAPKI